MKRLRQGRSFNTHSRAKAWLEHAARTSPEAAHSSLSAVHPQQKTHMLIRTVVIACAITAAVSTAATGLPSCTLAFGGTCTVTQAATHAVEVSEARLEAHFVSQGAFCVLTVTPARQDANASVVRVIEASDVSGAASLADAWAVQLDFTSSHRLPIEIHPRHAERHRSYQLFEIRHDGYARAIGAAVSCPAAAEPRQLDASPSKSSSVMPSSTKSETQTRTSSRSSTGTRTPSRTSTSSHTPSRTSTTSHTASHTPSSSRTGCEPCPICASSSATITSTASTTANASPSASPCAPHFATCACTHRNADDLLHVLLLVSGNLHRWEIR